mmetsp:Transcript_62030/g.150175  ORF Transcript_62030/g.150175 Transcript_62030/m.150175 type:complete len:314 (-) Transcript_62030:1822-2763(-)
MPGLEETPHDRLVVVWLHLPHLVQIPLEVLQRGLLVLLGHLLLLGGLAGLRGLVRLCCLLLCRLFGTLLTIECQLGGLGLRSGSLRRNPVGADLVDLEVLLHLELVYVQLQEVGPGQALALLLVAGELADLCNGEDVVDEHRGALALGVGGVHGPDEAVLQVLGQLVAGAELPGHVGVDLDVALLEEARDALRPLGHGAAHHRLKEEVVNAPQQRQCSPEGEDQLGGEAVGAKVGVANIHCALDLIEVDLLLLLAAIDDGKGRARRYRVLHLILLFFLFLLALPGRLLPILALLLLTLLHLGILLAIFLLTIL